MVSPTKETALIAGCSLTPLPAVSPKPLTIFHTPFGNPASTLISASKDASQRAKFGRFMHNAATCRQRRRYLPRCQHKRCVPRSNSAHRTNRRPHRQIRMLSLTQCFTIFRFDRFSGEKTKILRAARCCLLHKAYWLTAIAAFHQRNFLRPCKPINSQSDSVSFGALRPAYHATPEKRRPRPRTPDQHQPASLRQHYPDWCYQSESGLRKVSAFSGMTTAPLIKMPCCVLPETLQVLICESLYSR